MDVQSLVERLPRTVFAFRGYNFENLGRTPEMLAHPVYGPIVADYLQRASHVCWDTVWRHVDLVRRGRERQELSIDTYDESIAFIVAIELAQIQIMRDIFGIDYERAPLAMGYSLGELTALICSGV